MALEEAARIDDAWWSGAVTAAESRLREIAASAPEPVVMAAREALGVWYLHDDRVEDATAIGSKLDVDTPARAVVAAQIAVAADQAHRARSLLAEAVVRWPTDINLALHLAALRTGPERVGALNRILTDAGHNPVEVRPSDDGEIRFDGLVAGTARTGGHHDGGQPLVSVIVPAFDAEAWIASALASLQAQTHTNLQILVVDDASRDSTADIVRGLARSDARISLVRRRSNGGAYAARNDGLAQAVGRYVCVHDADDWAHPDRIAVQVAYLMAHPEVMGTLTALVRVDRSLRAQPHGRHPYKVVGKNTASLMVPRDAFAVLGPWDSGVRSGADFEFLKRLEARYGPGSIVTVDSRAPLTLALRRPRSLTTDAATGMSSLWHLHGARRQYLEAFTMWHGSSSFVEDLPLDPRSPRRFAAPAAARGVDVADFVDVIVRADVSAGSTEISAAVDEIVAAVASGRSSVVWHDPCALASLERPIDPRVMGIFAEGHSRLAARGESITGRELVIVGVPGLDIEGAPRVRADQHRVIPLEASPPLD